MNFIDAIEDKQDDQRTVKERADNYTGQRGYPPNVLCLPPKHSGGRIEGGG